MKTRVEGNRLTKTVTGPYRKPSLTVTLRTSLGWDALPMTSTLTDTWDYGTNFETHHYTSGPRRYP